MSQQRRRLSLTFYVVAEDPMKSPALPLLLQFLNGHLPTSTYVPVQSWATPRVLFEINAVAAVRNPRKLSLPQESLTS